MWHVNNLLKFTNGAAMLSKIHKYLTLILAVICVVLLCIVFASRSPETVGQTAQASTANEVAGKTTSPVNVAVQTFNDSVKNRLNLPSDVAANKSKKVVSASKVKASSHPSTVTTLIDSGTGKTETYVRTDPLPWLSVSHQGGAGASILQNFRTGDQVLRLHARQDLVQIKALHLSGVLSADIARSSGQTDPYAGLNIEYRW
jgi:hypothetical protein